MILATLLALTIAAAGDAPVSPSGFLIADAAAAAGEGAWIDLHAGAEISFDAMIRDLASADVLYLGESHGTPLHHAAQEAVIAALCLAGCRPALAMEQIEQPWQEDLDLYAGGSLDFDGFSQKTSWGSSWKNYADYRGIMERVRLCGGTITAANAPATTIRAVSVGGIASLDDTRREQLPPILEFNQPAYEKLLDKLLMVHPFMVPERKRFMYEAQICRDEAMAEAVARLVISGRQNRPVVLIAGQTHVRYGLGVPSRVESRTGPLKSRIIVVADTAGPEPDDRMRAKPTGLTRDDLKAIGPPPADYLYLAKEK
jgi:uncharacterized iron-regulated protein